MAKLTDLRDKLRSGKLEEEHQERNRQYKLNPAGDDAMILFGKHKSMTLRQILARDPSYLNWLLQEDFPAELKDVVRHIQRAGARASDMKAMSEAAEKLGEVVKGAGEKAGKLLDAVGAGVVMTVDSIRDEVAKLSPEQIKKILDEIPKPTTVAKMKTRMRNEDIIGTLRRAPRFGGATGFKPKARHR